MSTRSDLPCLILAAGMGKRLRPLTDYLPKPMIPIANRPVLEHILRGVAAAGFRNVYLNLHHRPDDIVRYLQTNPVGALRISWRVESALSGPAGALLAFEDEFIRHNAVLVISGDALHNFDLVRFVDQHLASSCQLSVVMKEITNPGRYGVAEVDARNHVVSFSEKPALPNHARGLVSCGVYCLDPALLSRFPRDRVYDFGADLIPFMASSGEDVLCHRTESYWCDIGDLPMMRNANLDAVTGTVKLELPGEEVSDKVWAEPGAQIASSAEIVGPVLIGSNAQIMSGAQIVGPAVLGPRSVVGEGAWLVRSVLLPESRVARGALLSDGLLSEQSSSIY